MKVPEAGADQSCHNARLRVLAITHDASRTGAPRAFVQSLEALRRHRPDVELVALSKADGPRFDDIRALSDVAIGAFDSPIWQLRRIARIRLLRTVAPAIERWVADRYIKVLRPDFVYVSSATAAEFTAAAVRQAIPNALHVHELEPLASYGASRGRLSWVDCKTIAVSEFSARELRALGAEVLRVIPGPAPIASQPNVHVPYVEATTSGSPRAYRVVGCGTATEDKGVFEFLELAATIRAIAGRAVKWTWLGAGDALERMRTLTRERGLSSHLEWPGGVESAESQLATADVLCFPTHRDNAPLTILEAAAVGTPTVGFNVGGVPEIAGTTDGLVGLGDVFGLGVLVTRALLEPSFSASLVEATRPVLARAEAGEWGVSLVDALTEAGLPTASTP